MGRVEGIFEFAMSLRVSEGDEDHRWGGQATLNFQKIYNGSASFRLLPGACTRSCSCLRRVFSFRFCRCGFRLLFSFALCATGCISKIRTQYQPMDTPAPQRRTRSVRQQAAGNRAECVRNNLFRITLFSPLFSPRTVFWFRCEQRGALCSRGN